MKKYIFILCCCLFLNAVCFEAKSQSLTSIDRLYSKFSGCDEAQMIKLGPTTMAFAKSFALFSKEGKEALDVMRMVRMIQVLDLSDCNDEDRRKFSAEVQRTSLLGYDLLMEMGEGDEDCRIFIRKNKETIKDFVLINYGEDPSIIRIRGSIPIRFMQQLMEMSGK